MRARCYPDNNVSCWYPNRGCSAPNPHEDHECGIYGWYGPELIGGVKGLSETAPILGVIEVSGKTLLGDRGFRAEHATVRALSYIPIEALARCHSHGITTYTDHEAMMADWPPQDLSGLVKINGLCERSALVQSIMLQAIRLQHLGWEDWDRRMEAEKKFKDTLDILLGWIDNG